MTGSPQLNVPSVRRVFSDGNHNAFTDLCVFRDRFYLTFRSCPDGHGVSPTSRIVVLCSEDATDWREVFGFNAPYRDVRDPHFLVFTGKLFVYTGTWLCHPDDPGRRDLNDHLGYGAWSADGESWAGPMVLEGTYGHYIWRAASCGDRAYLCGRRKRAFDHRGHAEEGRELIQSAMLESEDGLVWRTAALFAETCGDETAFVFEPDGTVVAIVRGPGSQPAQVCRSQPPYSEWTRRDLDRYIGGPLLARWGDRLLVGGRQATPDRGAKTTIYWLVNDALVEIAELPSGGDNSYPGFVALSETRGLLSYYSSHEGSGSHHAPAAIYLAELEIG